MNRWRHHYTLLGECVTLTTFLFVLAMRHKATKTTEKCKERKVQKAAEVTL